jgi:ADP-heptose:LPS heptosyltransferase
VAVTADSVTAPGARTVVALRALGLGDFLTGLPAYRALRRAFPRPRYRLLLAAPPALAPLVRLVDEIDALLPCRPLGNVRGVARPDVAVNLHGRGPQSHEVLLDLAPGRLIAWRHPDVPESAAGPEHRDEEHEVDRWCRLLRAEGIAADPSALDLQVVAASPVASGYAVVHPGAASPARRWPVERFAAIARALADGGHRVVVTGVAPERSLAAEVVDGAGRAQVSSWAGRLDLGAMAALVRSADLVVCGDTGVAHLATAVSTPSVVLFGPLSPKLWGPPKGRPIHRVLFRGGGGDPHADRADSLLLAIQVDEVLDAVRSALEVAQPPRAELAAR